MNNFSITNRLRRVFNITENSLNVVKVIFPIDIFNGHAFWKIQKS